MTRERWQEIERLFSAAEGQAPDSAALLASAEPDVRAEVERMLAACESFSPLDEPPPFQAEDSGGAAAIPGSLGPYKLEGLLGQGGMGRVFRATDTRLGRAVAVKISDESFSDRFEREARAIAALNHPHICTLYDVGPNYLVMERVEGETLAARLKRGRLATEQVLQYGAQIAGALAAAHAKGIVHRDLKPGNIMLTKSGVKVLDFGLAKSTHDVDVTADGAVMGTPAYMAPEQFEGRAVDAVADIYSLGVVLYEMAAGKKLSGERAALEPAALDRVIRRCLQADPDERWQSARDLEWELESIAAAPAAVRSRSWNGPLAAGLGAVTLLAAALAVLHFGERPAAREPAAMSVLLPEKSRVLSLELSPNGREIAMVLVRDGRQQIWVRALDRLEPVALAGTDDARGPFWSPDGRFIGFFSDAKLKKVDHQGGPVQTICDALAARGGSWNQFGDILFGGLTGVQRVAEGGGAVSGIFGHAPILGAFPHFLPDGRHFLVTRSGYMEHAGVWLHSMDGADARQIVRDVSNAEILAPAPASGVGTVIFTRAGVLMGLPFDMKRLVPAGEPEILARGIAGANAYWLASGWLASASRNRTLVYVSGQRQGRQYVWRDRQGAILGAWGEAGNSVSLCRDGKWLVGDFGGTRVMDLARGVSTELTLGRGGNRNPVCSPDGRWVALGSAGRGMSRALSSGAGQEELLAPSASLTAPESWSADGRFILYVQVNPGTGPELMAVAATPGAKPFAVVQTPASQGQFSPDGRWVAYTSDESGLSEIYAIPFPPSAEGGKWLVSKGGGVQARWSPDGKEIFYISPDSRMMAASVSTQPEFQAGKLEALFQTEIVDTGIRTGPMSWDIAPDGKRFLIISETGTDAAVTVVWK